MIPRDPAGRDDDDLEQVGEIEGYALTIEQRALWAPPVPWLRATLTLSRPVERAALAAALDAVTARHEVLRTRLVRLPGMTTPLQAVAPPGPASWAIDDQDTEVRGAPDLSLSRGPVLHASLSRDAANTRLALSVPALVCDRFALRDLAAAVIAALEPPPAGAPPADSLPYLDYAAWQEDERSPARLAADAAYWRRIATGAPPPAALPQLRAATPVPAERVAFRAALPAGRELGDLARRLETSEELLLHAVAQLLLWRLGDRPSAVLSWVQRDHRRGDALAGAIGRFAAALPVITPIHAGDRLSDVVAALATTLAAHEPHALGFSAEDTPALALTATGCAFSYVAWPPARAGVMCAALDQLEPERTDAGVELLVHDRGDQGLAVEVLADRARLSPAAAQAVTDTYAGLLDALVADPTQPIDRLPLLTNGARARVLAGWNDTRVPPATRWVHDQIADQAARTPDALAVAFEGEQVSFAACDRRANQLANHLRELGVRPGDVVGLGLPRSAEAIVCLLGILKAGAAYLPLDPESPAARLRLMLEDAGARAVVTTAALAEALAADPATCVRVDADRAALAAAPDRAPALTRSADSLAYVLYTSGSTGRPKGVMISHGALANLGEALEQAIYRSLDRGPGGRPLAIALNAALTFDASVKQIIQLARGRALHVLDDRVRLDPRALTAYVTSHALDVLDLTPTQLRMLIAESPARALAALPVLLLGGEAIERPLWDLIVQHGRGAFNLYGPTECTVDTTVRAITADVSEPTMGRPLANVQVYVVDDAMQPLPAEVPGELYIGGAGVALGYAGRPQLTAERFVPDPFAGAGRLYRTGDRARWTEDGELVFLGRRDHQIKLRGLRIELEEIEAALRAHPMVTDAAAVMRDDGPGGPQLVGYAAPRRAHAARVGKRRRHQLANGLAIVAHDEREVEAEYRAWFEHQLDRRHGLCLPATGAIVDVGAGAGLFTLRAALASPAATVYAFEPAPARYDALALNAELYETRARTFACGLGAHDHGSEPGRAGHPEGAWARRLSDALRDQRADDLALIRIAASADAAGVLAGIDEADWARVLQVLIELDDATGPSARALTELLARRGLATVIDADTLPAGRAMLYARRPGRTVEPAPAGIARDPRAVAGVLVAEDLRPFLRRALPEWMVPSQLVVLPELPLTASGKVDRRALPAPPPAYDPGALDEQRAPRGELERRLAAIWAEVLGVPRVGRTDSFFDLGGHSLLLVQVHRRIASDLGHEVAMLDLFRNPTVAALARLLGEPRPARADAELAAREVAEVEHRATQRAAALKRQQTRMKPTRSDDE